LLAQSWLLVERTVFEIVEVHTGTGLVVRDLRTGDVLDVRERTMSRHTQVGDRWCARAVPDGESHQFIGGLFIVAPGTEIGLLELLEVGDPFALCEWVRNLHSAPRLATREGEPLVACTTTMRVGDPVAALAFLDAAYERHGETWHEMYELSEDERVVRATLVLSGDVLTVSTHSEPRLARVLAAVRDAIPDVTVLTDERLPMTADKIGEVREAMAKTIGSSPGAAPVSLSTADREEILAMMERRWLNEPVPALQGLTPVAAAADPTRRDDVVRLLRSFPTGNDDHDLVLRPERLLAELGLG
jgi:hypothetical protein